jgi:hypothetical protein
MNLTLIAPPVCEPVSIADFEGQVRLYGQLSDEAQTVELMISAARESAEGITNRALVTQVWELSLDSFPSGRNPISLPMPPLQSVQFIKYYGNDGVEQTFYEKDVNEISCKVYSEIAPNCGNGYVMPIYGLNWPTALPDLNSVRVRFTCGYGPIAPDTALNVPKAICQWLLINVANQFSNRETVGIGNRETKFDITETICDGLVAKYRIPRL